MSIKLDNLETARRTAMLGTMYSLEMLSGVAVLTTICKTTLQVASHFSEKEFTATLSRKILGASYSKLFLVAFGTSITLFIINRGLFSLRGVETEAEAKARANLKRYLSWGGNINQYDFTPVLKYQQSDILKSAVKDWGFSNFTPLAVKATKYGNADDLQLLNNLGVILGNITLEDGQTLLHIANQENNSTTKQALSHSYGLSPVAKDIHGKTPQDYQFR